MDGLVIKFPKSPRIKDDPMTLNHWQPSSKKFNLMEIMEKS